ncbi:MAG: gamma-glutamyl-gamma-aminobutyrate hydrolase family protein [Woeseiaceae bacterium]|nr:gamma-glutamyl-gamma-aminobutyrate hydrolase family protein [Woeseiaceae bacterium]
MAARLIIGVTGPSHGVPWAWWATRSQLKRAGVAARRLNASTGYPGDDIAGFIIGGGNDIDPAIYGGDVSASRSIDPARDAYELKILDLAEQRGVPVMGICRGAQLINVHRGGTLVSDLANVRVHTSNKGTLLPRKAVTITAESTLAELIGSEHTRVNSLHHQAVEQTGDGLVVNALDRDQIVQGIEAIDSGPLRIGVQWHPEYMPQRRDQRRLFAGFVKACGA